MTSSPRVERELRGDSAVDAAAHGDERALGSGARDGTAARGLAERAVERVGGKRRGVELARAQPAELLGDLARADARGVEERPARDQLDHGAAGGRGRAAAARVEAGLGDAIAVDLAGRSRTRSPHGAPPAAPVPSGASRRPRPRGAVRWSSNGGVHADLRAD